MNVLKFWSGLNFVNFMDFFINWKKKNYLLCISNYWYNILFIKIGINIF